MGIRKGDRKQKRLERKKQRAKMHKGLTTDPRGGRKAYKKHG